MNKLIRAAIVLTAVSLEMTYTYTYDAEHRVSTINDSRGNKTTTYAYSRGGLLNRVSEGARAAFDLRSTAAVARRTERTEQHIRDRTIHRLAHQDRKDEARKTVERTGNDEYVIAQRETGRR